MSTEAKLDLQNWLDLHARVASGFADRTKSWLKSGDDLVPQGKSHPSSQGISSNGSNIGSNSGSLDPNLADITRLLVENQAKSMLPASEPKKFDGKNPLDYKQFILSFERTIEARTTDSADRYYNLIKYKC